jgi:tRNA (guanine9-N1)-methyltransferase
MQELELLGRDGVDIDYTHDQDIPLTQNAQKRLAKKLRLDQKWKRKKAEKKEDQRKKQAELAGMRGAEHETRQVWSGGAGGVVAKVASEIDWEQERAKKEKAFLDSCASGYQVVIDCAFDEFMMHKEKKSLCQQIMYCHGANKRAQSPCSLYITGIAGDVSAGLHKINGFKAWPGVHSTEVAYEDMFPQEKLVYLTADSETILETMDTEKIYIIGGIVDHNRLKNITFNKAARQNIATAKFPITENDLKRAAGPLTVNHTYDILLNYGKTGSWVEAFDASLPKAKRRREQPAADSAAEGVTDGAPQPPEKQRARQETGEGAGGTTADAAVQ